MAPAGNCQAWLADERFASSRLVLVTRRALATGPDEDVLDLATAAVWGLVRGGAGRTPGPVRARSARHTNG